MMIAPYDGEREYDIIFEKVVDAIDQGLKNDDDFLLICGGDPGTGKTRLMFHAYTRYAGEAATIRQVALNPRDFAITLDRSSKLKSKRFAGFDEANVSKREALTKWNRKLIDLYMNIRGLNIFHWWNNPSVEMLDKPFIEERVKGMIFILTKNKDKPRIYFYFTKDGLLRLLEEKGNLKKRTIAKHGHIYAHYLGWFKDYKGPLLEEYVVMKGDRMMEKMSSFREEFAPAEKFSIQAYANQSNIDRKTAARIVKYGMESHLLVEGEHYWLTGTGQAWLLPKGVEQADYIRLNDLYRSQKSSLRLVSRPPKASHSIHPVPGVER